jgi:hypothetical protein
MGVDAAPAFRYDHSVSKRLDIGHRGRLGVESNYEEQVLEGGQRIIAHKASVCRGDLSKKRPRHCPLHRRTDHHMRAWPQHWRDDRGIMERTCPHGIGHPDPDDPTTDTVHGCDGCCARTRNTRPA